MTSSQVYLLSLVHFVAWHFLSASLPVQARQQIRNQPQAQTRALTATEIARKVLPSVVILTAQDSTGNTTSLGSGFFIRDDVIATSLHVTENSSSVRVKLAGRKTEYAVSGFVGVDKQRDLALLKIQGLKGQPLNLASHRPQIGDTVYVVGSPEGLENTFSHGLVSGFRRIKGIEHLQISAPISHGSSGGPVLSVNGEVI